MAPNWPAEAGLKLSWSVGAQLWQYVNHVKSNYCKIVQSQPYHLHQTLLYSTVMISPKVSPTLVKFYISPQKVLATPIIDNLVDSFTSQCCLVVTNFKGKISHTPFITLEQPLNKYLSPCWNWYFDYILHLDEITLF